MNIKNIELNVNYKELNLENPEKTPNFRGFILENTVQLLSGKKHPAVIICPGGAYQFTSEREGTPVALEYLNKGISAFVLDYSCTPSKFPTALVELATAVKMVRENAEEWGIDQDKITVCGFSAGGHLTGCLGVFWNHDFMKKLGFDSALHKPNALILSYPVITASKKGHQASLVNLLGDEVNEKKDFVSLENHITSDLQPLFIWHTFTDTLVPVQNSMMFASKAIEKGILTELHIYPKGPHALSTGTRVVGTQNSLINSISTWVDFSVNFINNL